MAAVLHHAQSSHRLSPLRLEIPRLVSARLRLVLFGAGEGAGVGEFQAGKSAEYLERVMARTHRENRSHVTSALNVSRNSTQWQSAAKLQPDGLQAAPHSQRSASQRDVGNPNAPLIIHPLRARDRPRRISYGNSRAR